MVRLYLIPKSWVGPTDDQSLDLSIWVFAFPTSGIVAGSKKDSAGSVAFPDDVTCGRCAEDAVLSDQEFLYPVRRADLRNELRNFWVVEAAISSNYEEASVHTLRYGKKDTSDEGLAVVRLLEDFDLFAKP